MKSEKELLQNISRGKRMAMKALYERYSGYMMAIAVRYVPDRENARDIVQDSFVKILTTIEKFEYRGEGSLKAWMSKIVSNKALNYLRNTEKINITDDFSQYEATSENPDVELVPPGLLTKMIGELPPGYRAVLNMFVFEELSHKEIAVRLGIKENSSASQFSRAKHLLAKKINNYLKRKSV